MSSSRKIKFVRQLDTTDCGPACLTMITQYFGANYTLDYLNELCQKSIVGVDFISLSNASVQLGLETQAIRIAADVFSEEALPCILHWNNNHFVVLYKVVKNGRDTYFYIADPAFKKHKLPKSEFIKHFEKGDSGYGYAMLFSKNELFESLKSQHNVQSIHKYALTYLKTYKYKFLQLILLMFLTSCVTLVIPYTAQLLVDKAIKFNDYSLLTLLILAQFALFLGDSLLSFLRNWLTIYVSGKIGLHIIQDFLRKLFKLPMPFFDSKSYGDLSQRINDHARLEQFLTSDLVNSLFSIANLVVYTTIVYTYGLSFFLIFTSCIFLGMIWMYGFQEKRKKVENLQFQKQVVSQNKLHEIVGGIQDIKLFGIQNQHNESWSEIQQALVQLELKSAKIDMLQSFGYSLFQHGKNILLTFLAALAVMKDQLSLGGLLSLSFILGQTSGPLNQLLSFAHSLQDAKLSMRRLLSIQLLKEEVFNEDEEVDFVPGDICFNAVTFSYVGQHTTLLKSLSFTIPQGKTTAIVGESGSGKTTLLRMLLGYYQEFEGEITIGNKSLNTMDASVLRNAISTVMQDGYIFDQSFLYNITLCNEDEIDEKRFADAIKIAHLTDFVQENLKGNLHLKIGVNGLKISGGQQQRVLIARAIYKKASYFLFDEATSALDTENESIIMNNLYSYFAGNTVVLVAHRLSTIKNADNILVLKDGSLVEQGNHEVLLKKKGRYFDLIKNQL
jgi:ATP-binding cassette, subfamily B, bacterial